MINRNYLPYKSAREYSDRGMAKWMGFFISEHSVALSSEGESIDFTNILTEEEKMFYLSQAYLHNKQILLYTTLQHEAFLGKICDMTPDKLYLDCKNKTITVLYSKILKVTLSEVIENEHYR